MNEPLRVAMLSEHANPLSLLGGEDAGGQNVYVTEISRNLAEHGFAVDIFVRRGSPHVDQVVPVASGVRIVHLDAGPPEFLLKDALWPYMPAFRDAFSRFQLRHGARYDVLHGKE